MIPNWLEKAELSQTKHQQKQISKKDKNEKLRKDISQNFNKNAQEYDGFIQQMNLLIGRINALPIIDRQPFGVIKTDKKDGKWDNHLYIFSSSERIEKRLFFSLISFLKKRTFKHLRVIYIRVSKELGFATIELKDSLRKKSRRKADSTTKQRLNRKDRLHESYQYPMQEMNSNLSFELINWLTFKTKTTDTIRFLEQYGKRNIH